MKRIRTIKTIACFFGTLIVLGGCNSFWGNKTDISFIQVPQFTPRAVAYVPVLPIVQGVDEPTDICVGFDELIYVVDASAQQIRCYDESMRLLSIKTVRGVRKIVQDRTLDLLAIGVHDTLIGSDTFRLSCIYRLELKNSVYGLQNAFIEQKIIHPFYLTAGIKNSDRWVTLTGIAILADNSFYVSRTGTSQNNLVGGPDDAILYFDASNRYQYFVQTASATDADFNPFRMPSGITSFVAPPQSGTIRDRKDFAFLSRSATEVLKCKIITYSMGDDGPNFALDQTLTIGDTSKADGFLYTPNRFSDPSDIAFAGDGTQLLFIVDQKKDSLFIFNRKGLEGVAPPVGSRIKKQIKVSFGGTGQGPLQFVRPQAVAYGKEIVYVADAGNHRILRFKLTTDFR